MTALAASIPLDDPQFWLVTLVVAAAAFLAGRKIARSVRSESERPCASCPKSGAETRPALVALGGGRSRSTK